MNIVFPQILDNAKVLYYTPREDYLFGCDENFEVDL